MLLSNLQIIKISNCEEQLKPTQVLAKILITTREKVTQIRRDKLCFKNWAGLANLTS